MLYEVITSTAARRDMNDAGTFSLADRFTASLMIGAPELLVQIYADPSVASNAAMIDFAIRFMLIGAAFQLFDGIQAVASYNFV